VYIVMWMWSSVCIYNWLLITWVAAYDHIIDLFHMLIYSVGIGFAGTRGIVSFRFGRMFRWLFWTRVCVCVCVCVCVFMIRTPSSNTWSNTSRNLKCGLIKGNYFLCRPTGWVKLSFQATCREESLAHSTFSFIQLSPSHCTSILSSIMHRRPRVFVSEVVSLQGGHPFKMWHKTVLIQDVHFQGNLKGMF